MYMVVYYFNNGTTASHNIQREFVSAARRVFTVSHGVSHGKSSLNLVSAHWNNRAADPLKDRSRLRAFQWAQVLMDPREDPSVS